MSIRIPVDNDIGDLRLGAIGASEAYLGDILVWPLGCCGVTLNLPLDETPILDKSKPSKTISSATGLVVASVGSPARNCIDFTSGNFLYVNYGQDCNFGKKAFAIECDVFLQSTNDVITLFERAAGGSYALNTFKLYATHVFIHRERGSNTLLGGPDSERVKLFLPNSLQSGKWYRVTVQREANYRVTVRVKDWDTGVTTTGTTYMPVYDHQYITPFRDSFGVITGQYFTDVSFNGFDTPQIKIGGAGYLANYKVTSCQAPYAGPQLLPYPNIDPYYTSTSILLHFDDIEDQEFVDSGPYGLTPTKVGAPSIVTISNLGGTNNMNGLGMTAGQFGSGMSIWGAGNFLTYPDAPPGIFDLGDGSDFTIEFWGRIGGGGNPSAGGTVMGYYAPTPGAHYGNMPAGWVLHISSFGCSQGCSGAYMQFQAMSPTTNTHFYGGTGGPVCIDGVTGFPCSNRGSRITANGYEGVYSNFQFFPSEWNHFAVTRSGDTIRLFFNGKVVAYGPIPFAFPGAPELYSIEPDFLPPVFTVGGGTPYSPASAASLLKEVRITKGVARYVNDFELQSRLWTDGSVTPTAPAAPTLFTITQL